MQRMVRFYGPGILPLHAVVIFFLLVSAACTHPRNRLDVDISGVGIPPVEVKRYEEALFSVPADSLYRSLDDLASGYSFFTGSGPIDSSDWLRLKAFITDPLLRGIAADCLEAFPDLKKLEQELTLAFRYYRFHFSNAPLPVVYSFISGLDCDHPVLFTDTVLAIGLDVYLGADYEPYRSIGIPLYRLQWLRPEYMIVDAVAAMAGFRMDDSRTGSTFLDLAIFEGKLLYFMDALLPGCPDSLKMKYTRRQMNWVKNAEQDIWAFLLENEFLYSTDVEKIRKFFTDGPFTAVFSNESPARLGGWIGWQIVRSYMRNHPEVSLEDMMSTYDAQAILMKSGYKPARSSRI